MNSVCQKWIIRAALSDEANEGWVWLKHFPSRSIVKIEKCDRSRHVYCQIRNIDCNFISKYNGGNSKRIPIQDEFNTLVMSEWYRSALGLSGTTPDQASEGADCLNVTPQTRNLIWARMRATAHHPDTVVRLALGLAVTGLWLGLLGTALGIISVLNFEESGQVAALLLILIFVFSLIYPLWLACRGVEVDHVQQSCG